MTIYHQKAIELKYQGYTYPEISKSIGGKLSVQTLRNLFSVNGSLYVPYLEYEANMNNFNEEDAKREFKRQAAYSGKIMTALLQKALKDDNLRLAFDILKEQLDRAGLTVKRAENLAEQEAKKPSEKQITTHEEFVQESLKEDLDPGTGLRLSSIAIMDEQEREKLVEDIKKYWPPIKQPQIN